MSGEPDQRFNASGGDITIVNARIWTGDPQDPWKESMTVRDGKIVAMDGGRQEGEIVDGEGRLVAPGFWDGHCHPQTLFILTSPGAPKLFGAESAAAALLALCKYVRKNPDDPFPRLFGWMDKIFKEGAEAGATRQRIDEVVNDRPVYLVHHSGHLHWANTRALKLAGVYKHPPEIVPKTGWVRRNAETGLATGFLSETELASTRGVLLDAARKVEPLTFEQQVRLQQDSLGEYAKYGVTAIWTKDGDLGTDAHYADIPRIYEELLRRDQLPVRAVLDNLLTPYAREDELQLFAQQAREIEESDLPKGFLRADGVKLMVDLPYHAWMFEPYADDPGNSGHPVTEMAAIRRQVVEADRLGLLINLLTMGDRAVHEALNLLQELPEVNPPRPRRHTLEHASFISHGDLSRFRRLGVTAVMNPIGLYPDPHYQALQEARYGKQRLSTLCERFKDLIAGGAVVVQGSDFPLAPMDPILGMHLMVNGTDIHGQPEGGLWPNKKVSVIEALKTYTVNPAFAAHAEDRLGRLKVGCAGDFVMLSKNILDPEYDPSELIKVKAMLTVFNGYVLHEDFSTKEKDITYGGWMEKP